MESDPVEEASSYSLPAHLPIVPLILNASWARPLTPKISAPVFTTPVEEANPGATVPPAFIVTAPKLRFFLEVGVAPPCAQEAAGREIFFASLARAVFITQLNPCWRRGKICIGF